MAARCDTTRLRRARHVPIPPCARRSRPGAAASSANARTPVLLTCDHASNAMPAQPRRIGASGRSAGARHIGWDIGAAAVTRRLADALDAPAVLAGYSRLVIDCNRDPDDADLDPRDERRRRRCRAIATWRRRSAQRRREAIFAPYHAAIDDALARRRARRAPALIVDPQLHAGHGRHGAAVACRHACGTSDPRIPVPLLAALRADPALVVGDNQPYSAREPARLHGAPSCRRARPAACRDRAAPGSGRRRSGRSGDGPRGLPRR